MAPLLLAFMLLGTSFITASQEVAASNPAEFLAPHSAMPLDTNSDSIYELMKVYAGVRVTNASYYIVEAHFFQSMGVWMANSTSTTYLAPGDYSVETSFYGWPSS